MSARSFLFLIFVWCVSAALIVLGMDVSGGAYPLFGLVIPMFVSYGVLAKEN